MRNARNPGRFIGLLYVLISIPGAFALIYVPGKLIVDGNAAATAGNIAGAETLLRVGIAAQIVSQILFMWIALSLYDLLKSVNQRRAAIMLTLIGVSIPIALVNELNAMAALALAHGSTLLGVLEKAQRDALMMLFLNLHLDGFMIAQVFWGLWLFPLSLLVYRSGFLPRFLGVLLMISGFAYAIDSFATFVLPQYADIISRCVSPVRHGELVFMLWLLILGARPAAKEMPAPSAANV